jgi:hypothetical protein
MVWLLHNINAYIIIFIIIIIIIIASFESDKLQLGINFKINICIRNHNIMKIVLILYQPSIGNM